MEDSYYTSNYNLKNCFKKEKCERQNRLFQTKTENLLSICTIKSIKGSSSSRRSIIADSTLILYKEMKKGIDKYKRHFSPHFKTTK